MPDTDDIALAAPFPAATHEQWRRLVDGVLKGASFDTLQSRTADGLVLQPLYRRGAQARPLARADGVAWQIVQRIEQPDPATANAQAKLDLANGASGLALICNGAVGAYGFGLADDADSLTRVLDGVSPNQKIEISPGPDHSPLTMFDALASRGDTAGLRLGFDPIGACASSGVPEHELEAAGRDITASVADIVQRGFVGRAVAADGRVVHDAGGTEAQELAFGIACAVAYLRALEAAGLPLDVARRLIFFRLAADADQFLTIAKHRALRMLWARVESACGIAPEPIFISTQTAWRMVSARGTHVNTLRATLAAFCAAVGGADAITVLPHTIAQGLPNADARRLARNIQLLLMEESHLAKVADPAAGAGAAEELTAHLCEAAWSIFQEIERQGGAWTMLRVGAFAAEVAAARAQRECAVAQRRDALTGLSEFADLAETRDAVLMSAPIASKTAAALGPIRLAQPFERLRDRSDAILAQTGARPRVFLAMLGRQSGYAARAAFAKGLFEAGGIVAVSGEDVAAFAASGASIACLCASDEALAHEGAAMAAALIAAGARYVHVTAKPGDSEAALRQAGATAFIHAGCDIIEVLETAYDHLAAVTR